MITAHAPLGQETERKWLDLAKSESDDAPPTPQDLGLREADLPAVCALSAETVVKNLDPRFLEMPWEGTAYEPSHEFAVQMSQLVLDSVCG